MSNTNKIMPPAPELAQLVEFIAQSGSEVLQLLRPDYSDLQSSVNVTLGLEMMKTTAEAMKKLVENAGAVAEKEKLWAETKKIQAETERLVAEKEKIKAETEKLMAERTWERVES